MSKANPNGDVHVKNSEGNKKEEEIARLQYQMAFGTQKPDESTLVNGARNAVGTSNDQDDKESRLTERKISVAKPLKCRNK